MDEKLQKKKNQQANERAKVKKSTAQKCFRNILDNAEMRVAIRINTRGFLDYT